MSYTANTYYTRYVSVTDLLNHLSQLWFLKPNFYYIILQYIFRWLCKHSSNYSFTIFSCLDVISRLWKALFSNSPLGPHIINKSKTQEKKISNHFQLPFHQSQYHNPSFSVLTFLQLQKFVLGQQNVPVKSQPCRVHV